MMVAKKKEFPPCFNCGEGITGSQWSVAIADEGVSPAQAQKYALPGHGWHWQSVCSECLWEERPTSRRLGVRGPLLPGEVRV